MVPRRTRVSMRVGDDERPEPERCHVCDEAIELDDVAGRGLLVFPRGDDVEYEEPALCRRCSHAISRQKKRNVFRAFVAACSISASSPGDA